MGGFRSGRETFALALLLDPLIGRDFEGEQRFQCGAVEAGMLAEEAAHVALVVGGFRRPGGVDLVHSGDRPLEAQGQAGLLETEGKAGTKKAGRNPRPAD